MLSKLKAGPSIVGAKQVRRAVMDGRALRVFLADDADPRITDPLAELCREKQVPLETGYTMSELGMSCGIAVPGAVAALVR